MTKEQILELYRLMLINRAEAVVVDRKQYYEIYLKWEDGNQWPWPHSSGTYYYQQKTIAFPKTRR